MDQDDGLGDLLNQFSEDMENVPGDLLNGLLGEVETPSVNSSNTGQEDISEEESATLFDLLQDMTAEEQPEEMEGAGDISMDMPSKEPAEDMMTQQPAFEEFEQAAFEMPETSDSEAENAFISETDEPFVDDTEVDDLGSLLDSLGADGDEDVQEISDLLDKAERDEPIDNVVDSLMQGLNQEESQNEGYSGDDFLGEDAIEELLGGQDNKKKKEKKPRRSKKKKELQSADVSEDMQQETGDPSAEGEKKQGFWSKLLNALTQEDEDEEEPSDLVSDENGEILKELDKEKKQAKGKKKKKGKEKDKKAAVTDEEEDFEDSPETKQKKKKKEKKPKKEKEPVPAEEMVADKKLSLKKVLPLVAVFLVLCLAFVMVSQLYISHVNKQRAENAYYAGDYLECYSLFFGQELNESQEVMFHRSELVLQMERMKGNYRRLVMEGKELEALDYLVQCICRREDSYLRGQEWNSLDVVEEAYSGMLGLLTANYGLTEEQAKEIAALRKDTDYTIALLQVLEGIGSKSSDEESGQQDQPISYEDLLPEEEEDSSTTFVDTLG